MSCMQLVLILQPATVGVLRLGLVSQHEGILHVGTAVNPLNKNFQKHLTKFLAKGRFLPFVFKFLPLNGLLCHIYLVTVIQAYASGQPLEVEPVDCAFMAELQCIAFANWK